MKKLQWATNKHKHFINAIHIVQADDDDDDDGEKQEFNARRIGVEKK